MCDRLHYIFICIICRLYLWIPLPSNRYLFEINSNKGNKMKSLLIRISIHISLHIPFQLHKTPFLPLLLSCSFFIRISLQRVYVSRENIALPSFFYPKIYTFVNTHARTTNIHTLLLLLNLCMNWFAEFESGKLNQSVLPSNRFLHFGRLLGKGGHIPRINLFI